MSYNNDAKCACAGETPRPVEPLPDLMNETNEVGLAILAMAEKIEGNLFGEGNSREGVNPPPMCLRHALDNHRSTLILAADALCRICNQLGV